MALAEAALAADDYRRMSFATLNLEAGFPTVDDARRRLLGEMQSAGARGVRVIKVIHGWGSSGETRRVTPESGGIGGRRTTARIQAHRHVKASGKVGG